MNQWDPKSLRMLGAAAVMVLFGLLTACATPYLPSAPLLSPEAIGPIRRGQIELSAQGGSSFWGTPTTDSAGTSYLAMNAPRFTLGYGIPLDESTDLFFRIAGYAPPMVGIKYQLSGVPSDKVDKKQWAVAVAGSAGYIWGKVTGSSAVADTYTYFLGEAALLVGYRPWRYHQFGLNPIFRAGSLSGTSLFETGSFTQYGGSISYQYENESMFWRIEPSYIMGTFGSNELPNIQGGFVLGFRIDK